MRSLRSTTKAKMEEATLQPADGGGAEPAYEYDGPPGFKTPMSKVERTCSQANKLSPHAKHEACSLDEVTLGAEASYVTPYADHDGPPGFKTPMPKVGYRSSQANKLSTRAKLEASSPDEVTLEQTLAMVKRGSKLTKKASGLKRKSITKTNSSRAKSCHVRTLTRPDSSSSSTPVMLPTEAKSATGPAQAMSLNLTKVAALFDEGSDADEVASSTKLGLVQVGEYTIKEEFKSLLVEIFRSHGDIAETCISSLSFRSKLLERVCASLKTLQRVKFQGVVADDMELMLLDIDNVEKFGVKLGWLRERVEDILKARKLLGNYHLVKDARKKIEKEYAELRSHREEILKKMELLSREMEEQEMKYADTKKIVNKFMNMDSVVEGLLRSTPSS